MLNIPSEHVPEATEMGFLRPEKETRFQVNRVKSTGENGGNAHIQIKVDQEIQTDDEDNDLHSVTDRTRLNTDNAKSLRYLLFIFKSNFETSILYRKFLTDSQK